MGRTMKKERYLTIESPEDSATVDFLHAGAIVELRIENGTLRVVAKMPHGEDASTWDEHEIEWQLPARPSCAT